jgi:hypothetical protein
MFLIRSLGGCCAVLLAAAGLFAAEPAPEQLAPGDALALLTVPDWDQFERVAAATPLGQLWHDPEMKAFKEKFQGRWRTNVVQPLERELGIKFSDYLELLHGQVTLAVTRHGWDGTTNQKPQWVFLADTKDRAESLKTQLASLRKKWVDSGKTIKTEKIRDLEFTTLVFTDLEMSKLMESAFPSLAKEKDEADEKPGKTNRTEITFGQAGGLFLAGSSASDLEKVLVRRSGGMVPSLAEQAGFENQRAVLREGIVWAWLDLQTIIANFRKGQILSEQNDAAHNPLAPKPEKIFAGLGLDGLKSLAGAIKESLEGCQIQLSLRVPEGDRKGIFKVLAFEPKESQPPPYVPLDVLKFRRFRLDGGKAWSGLEATLAEISPDLNGLLQATLQAVGKEKDENFDFKKALLGSLGDDWVFYRKKPTNATPAALKSPPSITLVGSPNPEGLVQALRAASSVLPTAGGEIRETEFLGRKIYSLVFPASGATGGKEDGAPPKFCFAAAGGYVALSSTQSMIEEYLRSLENKPRGLAEVPGLAETAQKVGGMNSGLFGYENRLESMRILWEAARKDPAVLDLGFSTGPVKTSVDVQDATKDLRDWCDFTLLPPFDKVSKYFYFDVYAGTINADGLLVKFHLPTPPQLKK